jgi:transposase-like protein
MIEFVRKFKLWLGEELCVQCGSYNIIKRGFEGSNLRYECRDCGYILYIE